MSGLKHADTSAEETENMSFAWMRRIDTWVGKPMTQALGIFTRRSRSLYGDFHPDQIPRRVICTKFIGLGSIVLSLPLLKALKDSGAQIAFWSFSGQAELARISGFVDEVWVVRPTLRHFLPTLWKSWRQARRFKAEAFVDLEPTANFTAILGRVSGAPIRIGFMAAKSFREKLFTHLVALAPERHMIENILWIARYLGLPGEISARLPVLTLTALEDEVVSKRWTKSLGRKRIVINVNSSDLSWHRLWPEDSWIDLCKKLLEDPAVELVFPGIASERDRVSRITKRLGSSPGPSRVVDVVGKTTLVELLELLKTADQVISVDSGIMHLAAWVGVSLIGLFGPETPRLYSPRSPRARVLWAALPCSPCLSVAADKMTRCQDNQCMKRISSERVWVLSRSLLAETAAPSAEDGALSVPVPAPLSPEAA